MSTRARTRTIAVASVLLTAAVTGGTALLPSAAHAAEPQGVHSQAQAGPPARSSSTGDNGGDSSISGSDGTGTGELAGGALAFTATGIALAFGIRHRSRQLQPRTAAGAAAAPRTTAPRTSASR